MLIHPEPYFYLIGYSIKQQSLALASWRKTRTRLFRSYFSAFFPVRLVTHHYAITKSPRCFTGNTAGFLKNIATFSATHNYM